MDQLYVDILIEYLKFCTFSHNLSDIEKIKLYALQREYEILEDKNAIFSTIPIEKLEDIKKDLVQKDEETKLLSISPSNSNANVVSPSASLSSSLSISPAPHGKLFVLAFDAVYDEDGSYLPLQTGMYIPNDWVFHQAMKYPTFLIPIASVHPYRKDAIEELVRCHSLGARIVKWLPNSMNISLKHQNCLQFYEKMRELNMILLTHTELHSIC
jgi:hypothetical protein